MDSASEIRLLIRELSIMRQLSEMEDNYYTTKLLDVVVACKEGKPLSKSHGVFFVMNYIENDLCKMLDRI